MKDNISHDLCLHELFEHQVLLTPDAIAVVFKEQSLTYAQLNAEADCIARYLQCYGVRREDRIALCADRTGSMIAAILGCLKAGCAYVPLDPTNPVPQTLALIKAAQPTILIADCAARVSLEKDCAGLTRLVHLENCTSQWGGLRNDNTDEDDTAKDSMGVDPQSLAYVIYTSGSTGTPKGVMVEHGSVVNLISMLQRVWSRHEIQRSLQFASISFDASVKEIFFPLSIGATLILRTKEWIADARTFWRLCGRHQLNYVNLPSRFWQAIVQDTSVEIPSCVRLVVFGGESIEKTALETWFNRGGHRPTLVNAYGPTEATINAAINEVQDADEWRTVGRPVDNTEIYILDSDLNQVAVGVTGDLYISGTCLARGYFNDFELTGRRFQRNRFSADPAARMYQSGDLARWRHDGRIDLYGRNDSQVKIRGFRVELGEIQAKIIAQPDILDAVVISRDDDGKEPRLVAYLVVTGTKSSFDPEGFRNRLLTSLPEYKVPSAYVVLDSFPLLPSGKLNRRALPLPDRTAYLHSSYEKPRGHMEEDLARIWCELLSIGQVGRNDDFFSLGGNSLKAVQMASRLQRELAAHVDAQTVLATPILKDLARVAITANAEFPERFDPDAEAVLDPTIGPFPMHPAISPVLGMLLTGASGFFGSFLLASLFRQTSRKIYCLVRCTSHSDGIQRLRSKMKSYGLPTVELPDRVTVIPGDLSQPMLGLQAEQFARLAEAVDTIYHNGAWVHALHSYSTLKPTNVGGTTELIKLSQMGSRKDLHFISSLDALLAEELVRIGLHRDSNGLFYGYGLTKWIAERLLTEYALRGLRTAIYRPTYISGDTRNGASNPDDLLSRFIDGCLDTRCVPQLDFDINMLPVDFVADIVVRLSITAPCEHQTYNLLHPDSLNVRRLIQQLKNLEGFSEVTLEEWAYRSRDDARLEGLSMLLPQRSIVKQLKPCSHLDTGANPRCIDIEWNYPTIDDSLLSKYIQWRAAQREPRDPRA